MPLVVRIVVMAMIPTVLSIIVSCTLKSNFRESLKNLQSAHVVLRMPKIYMWIACLGTLFFTFLGVLGFIFPPPAIYGLVCVMFVLGLMGGSCSMYACHSKPMFSEIEIILFTETSFSKHGK